MRGTVSSYENSNLMCIYYLYLRAFWELPSHIFVDEQLFVFLFRYLCRYWNFSICFCLFMKLIDISLGQATISTGRVLGRSEWVNENGELLSKKNSLNFWRLMITKVCAEATLYYIKAPSVVAQFRYPVKN